MLKADLMQEAFQVSRLLSAIELKGSLSPLNQTIAEARADLEVAMGLKAGRSEDMSKALATVAKALEAVRDASGVEGFGKVADRARFLSLLFLGFAFNGLNRRGRKRKG
ncbi:hypothetical protein UFOVP549_17 [uncultured Caudovirales phage]|uniref:Uncharacterized protein n=1 Tax=uncultured Caudovirales phage TaxID=2100421 RepID=A0A6J5MVD9_9CAUD|nr:hypothetical protein UFOVP549_17 [uncultured Caudovirales phage]